MKMLPHFILIYFETIITIQNKTYYNINIRPNNSLLQKLKKLNHGVYHGYRSSKLKTMNNYKKHT